MYLVVKPPFIHYISPLSARKTGAPRSGLLPLLISRIHGRFRLKNRAGFAILVLRL